MVIGKLHIYVTNGMFYLKVRIATFKESNWNKYRLLEYHFSRYRKTDCYCMHDVSL